MIEFIKQTEKDELTLHDVEENQFFINNAYRLCQKVSECEYNVIADSDGSPLAYITEGFYEGDTILKVIDKIAKIKFE
jgi:hypothetical protein